MIPNQTTPTSYRKEDNRKRLIFVIVASSLLVILFIIWSVLNSLRVKDYSLNTTFLSADRNFGYLDGAQIYTYNGLVFSRVNYETGYAEILSGGVKLPSPSNLFWAGTRGALMNFDGSFYLSLVNSRLKDNDEIINKDTRDYTWYFDFNTGSLKLVDTSPVQNRLAYYSEGDGGFYLIAGNNLVFYDISSFTKRVVVDNLQVTGISHIGECASFKLCIIGYSQDDFLSERIYSVDDDDSITEILNSNGRVFPTNNPRYILLGRYEKDLQANPGRIAEEDDDYGNQKAVLYDLDKQTERDLDFPLDESNVIFGLSSEAEYFLFDDSIEQNLLSSDSSLFYRAGVTRTAVGQPKSKVRQVYFSDGTPFSGGIIAIPNVNSSGGALLTTFTGDQLLFTPTAPQGFGMLSIEEARTNVRNCEGASDVKVVDYFNDGTQFKIYFVNGSKLSTNIKTFSDCLSQTNTLGYNYYFGVLDPRSGRIITD